MRSTTGLGGDSAARGEPCCWKAPTRTNCCGSRSSAFLGALVLMAISTIKLISDLSRRALHALIIETAGTPHTAVISRDKDVVIQLVSWIMDAINNPQAEFEFRVENLQVGDAFQQFGNHNVNIGKSIR